MSVYDDDAEFAAFDRMLGIEPEAPAEPETPAVEEAAPLAPEVSEAPEPQAEAEEVVEEQPRDDQGRFAPKETAEEKLLAGKFKSPEELERAYSELQAKLGQQGNELGLERGERERLAAVLEKLDSRLDEPYEEQPQTPAQVDPEWFEDNLAENPQGMAYWAKENAPHLLGKVMKEWGEEDPFAAAQFVFDVRLQAMEEKFQQTLTEHTKPVQEITRKTAIEQAFTDANVVLDQGIYEAARFAPEVAKGLTSQNVEDRVRAAKALSYLAGGMSGLQQQAPAPAVPAPPAPAAPSAADAKLDGSVATQSQAHEAEQTDEGEQWLEDIGFNAYLDARSPQDA